MADDAPRDAAAADDAAEQEEPVAAYRGTSTAVTIAAAVMVALGALGLLFGFVVGSFAASALVAGIPGPAPVFALLGGAIIGLSALGVMSGVGLLSGSQWARFVAICVAALGVGAGVVAFVRTLLEPGIDSTGRPTWGGSVDELAGPAILALLFGYVIWAVWSRRRYPAD